MLPLCVLGVIGSVIGANILVTVNKELLRKLVGVVILLLLPLVFQKGAGVKRRKVSMKMKQIGYALFFLTAIWSAFFGGGTGIFFSYIYITFFGLTILEWKGTNKIPTFFIDLPAVMIFALAPSVGCDVMHLCGVKPRSRIDNL